MLRPKVLDHVGLVVADLDRTLRFYVDGLGLELLRRRDQDGGRSSAVLRVGSQEINLFCDPAVTGSAGAAPRRLDHFCLEMDYATMGELVAALRDAGMPITSGPVTRRDGAGLFLSDPDGVRVELQIKTAR
jgi:catechol 2,3-dioxygenase-like lactoylglutathione lyase family enzyme